MHNRYRIPKRRVPIRIYIGGEEEELVHVFTSVNAEARRGRERPSDMLEQPTQFLAVERANQEIAILSKSSISFAIAPTSLEADGETSETHESNSLGAKPKSLVITLEDGRQIRGVARAHMPDAHGRIIDWLNRSERFARLDCTDGIYLVNKSRIVCVEECTDR